MIGKLNVKIGPDLWRLDGVVDGALNLIVM